MAQSPPLSTSDRKALKELMDLPMVEDAIRARLPNIIQGLIDLAEGITRHEIKRVGDDWVDRCYSVPPDRQAAQFLIENVIGKVPSRVEMTGDDGGPLQIMPWIPKLAAMDQGLLKEDAKERLMLEEARDATTE